MYERLSEAESAINCLMTLYLLKRSSERVDGITKLQKLTFAAQNEMQHEGICAISGEFFRWNHGPMSDEVYKTHEILVENDLVEDRALSLTDRGNEVLRDFTYIIEDNEEIFTIIDRCIDAFAPLSLHDLKEKIYSMIVIPFSGGEPQAIRDLPFETTILCNKGFTSLNIEEADLETLEIYLDKEMYESLLRGMDDAKNGRICSIDEPC